MLVDREKIQEAKEKLGDRNAELLQEIYQIDKWDSRNLKGCCPNPDHPDNNPSCSYDRKLHRIKCFSCNFSADLIQAQMSVNGMTFIDACAWLFEQAGIPFEYMEKGKRTHGRDYNYPQPTYADNKEKVYRYWGKRGISKATIDYLGIQQDPHGNTLFEYYDLHDVLVDVKVRKSGLVKKGEKKCWHLTVGSPANVLYNINRIVPDQPLIITCGEGDCAAVVECGFQNTVSINGGDGNTQWIGECWDWLEQFNEIILVPDNDESGKKFTKEVSKRLGEYRVKIVDVPSVPRTDPNTGEPDLSAPYVCDFNEYLLFYGKENAIALINEAKEADIPSIVDYTDVKRFDMSDVPGFETGIKDLDNALVRFYMGSTTILTGAPGSGKTSFLSTLICQAVEQGFPTFVYSGELSNPSLKSWIDFVHAGRWGLNEYQTTSGSTYYKVSQDAFDAINAEYKGNIFFYKDTMSQKVSDLLAAAETVVRRYGVKFLVWDNMSSVDLECGNDDKWHKQEEFVRNIIQFSSKWNVCCVVVLHPKKVQNTRISSLYELSGVATAVNLAHRVLSLYRVTDKEKRGELKKNGDAHNKNDWYKLPCRYDVLIDVLKDRFGSGLGQTSGIFYDVPSKRFYDKSPGSLFSQYRWDKANHAGQKYVGGLPTPEQLALDQEEIFGPPLPQ